MSSCILCLAYHPSAQPRLPHFPPACNGCRERLRAELTDLVDAYAQLPAALVPGKGHGQRVSGSRVPPVPVDVDVVDLGGRRRITAATDSLIPLVVAEPVDSVALADAGFVHLARIAEVENWSDRRPVRDENGKPVMVPANDQVGHLPTATELDWWVRDWAGRLGHHLPNPNVTTMVGWLLNRLDDAIDHHPAIDEFAADIHRLLRTLRGVARSAQYRGDKVGRCPMLLRDDTYCATQLYADPYLDRITCSRCGTSWDRVKWLALRAAQDEMPTEGKGAA